MTLDAAAPDCPALAHIREISPKIAPDSYATSTRDVHWHEVPEGIAETFGSIADARDNLVAVWPASPRRWSPDPASQIMTPFVHIPHCRLDMTTVCNIPHQSGHIEEVALPGPTIRTLLTSLTLPDDTLAPSILSHFDDHDDWVHSRCVQSDFSGLGEHEARRLSDQGRLCCWASMMLRPGDTSTGGLQWDLCFVIHKVVARRDSESSRCACP